LSQSKFDTLSLPNGEWKECTLELDKPFVLTRADLYFLNLNFLNILFFIYNKTVDLIGYYRVN